MWKKLIIFLGLMGVLIVSAISFPPNPIQSPYGDMDYAVIGGKPYILFNNSFVNFNITFGLRQGGDYHILPNAPYFHLEDNDTFKYGLNVFIMLPQPFRVKYIINSNLSIQSWAFDSYYIPKNDTSSLCYDNPFQPCNSKDPRLYFAQVCDKTYNNESEIIFDPECMGNLTNNNKTLELYFTIPAGLLDIDPTVTWSTNTIESIAMDVIDNDEFIIAYCDETQDDTSIYVGYTNGTLIYSGDVDGSNGGCTSNANHQVDVEILDSSLNKTAIIWIDINNIPKTAVVDYTKSTIVFVHTVAVSKASAVTLAVLNSTRYVGGWIDSGNFRALVKAFDDAGFNLTGRFIIDSRVGKDTQAIAMTSFPNHQNFSTVWFDSDSNTILFTTLSINYSVPTGFFSSGELSGTFTVDTLQSSGNGAVSIDSFDHTNITIGWKDVFGIGGGLKYAIYNKNGTNIVSETLVDSSAGATESVSVSTRNATAFLYGYHHFTSSTTKYTAYSIAGTQLFPIQTAWPSVNVGRVAILSTNNNQAICENNFIIASTVFGIPGGGESKTYLANGSLWADGRCVCEYTDYLNWNPPCDCYIDENQTMKAGSTLQINGSGNFNITNNATISGFDSLDVFGVSPTDRCYLNLDDGGSIR